MATVILKNPFVIGRYVSDHYPNHPILVGISCSQRGFVHFNTLWVSQLCSMISSPWQEFPLP